MSQDNRPTQDARNGGSDAPLPVEDTVSLTRGETSMREEQPDHGQVSPIAATPDEAGPTVLGRYRVLRALGRGGFGEVYVAHDPQLNREVALKVPRTATSEADIEAFMREARSLAQLHHPGIVAVHDVGVHEGRCYIVSEYLQGVSLRDWLKQRRPTWQQAVEIVAALADALAHAHARRMVHRDVKHSNVIMRDDQPVLVDFGLALSDEVDTRTERGVIAGSASYMSPEQVVGKAHRIDGRTDIFSLGVILYELLSGSVPFRAANEAERFRQIYEDDPQPLRQLVPELPPALERICLKAMAKQQADRYTTAADMARELRQVLAGSTAPAPTAEPTEDEATRLESAVAATSGGESTRRRAREAERRQLTLLYCGCEITADEEAEVDPEDEHDVVLELQQVCEQIVARWDGTIVQTAGQERLICFGYPLGFEDAARRGVYSALALMQEMARVNGRRQQSGQPPLEAWVVIHTGLAVVGESREAGTSESFSLVGEARNVVTRLDGFAEPGNIVISQPTHRLVRGFFDCESLGARRVKGVPRSLELFRVLGKSAAHSRIEAAASTGLTPLVGRDREVELLLDRWEEVEEGNPQVVLITGEAGLGKSRLVHVLKEHVTQATGREAIVEWDASTYFGNSSLHPAIEYFRQTLELDRVDTAGDKLEKLARYLDDFRLGDPQEVVPLFASLLSIPLDDHFTAPALSPQRIKERTLEVILDWVRQKSAQHPLLFVVEDLHWIDPSSLELLESLINSLATDRVFALFTFRPEFEPPWRGRANQTQVALNRLRKKQTVEMIRLRTGLDVVPPAVIEQLVERTAGVPLFIEEFATMVQETGGLAKVDGDTRLTSSFSLAGIPATLQDLLMARLDRMEADREVIQICSTLGREFDYELIRAVSPLAEDALQSELAKLVRAEVLFQHGKPPTCGYQFKHALIQDAAHESLLKKKRQQIHTSIADVLETRFAETAETSPELLAYHLTEAALPARAVPYWLRAGLRSQERSANEEAISQLTRGLVLLEQMEPSAERDQTELVFQSTLGTVYMAARGYGAPEVGEAFERAEALCAGIGAVTHQFFVMWGLWGWHLLRLELDECRRVSDDVLELVQASDEGRSLMSEAHWIPGCMGYYEGDFATSRRHCQEGFSLYNEARARSHALQTGQNSGVTYQCYIALTSWQMGFPDQAWERMNETVRLAEQLDHPFSLSFAHYHRRRLQQFCGFDDQVRRSVEQEYALAHEQGFLFWEAQAILARAENLARQGRLGDARQQAQAGTQLFAKTGARLTLTESYSLLADAFLLAGRFDEAQDWLGRAEALMQECNERFMESEMHRLRGELLLVGGHDGADAAQGCFERAIDVARRQQAKSRELRALMSLCQLWLKQGRAEEGRARLGELLGWFSEGFETRDIKAAQTLLAELGGP